MTPLYMLMLFDYMNADLCDLFVVANLCVIVVTLLG